MARRWADVAELVATQGLKGRLVARSVRDLPFLLEEGMPVHFVPPTLDAPRQARVVSVQHLGGYDYLVEFDAVSNRDAAESLAGSHCLVDREFLPPDFEELLRGVQGAVGFSVHDEAIGLVGQVVGVREMPMQDLLVVAREGEEVLIPFVDEFVLDIDEDARIVRMSLPAGLVELNARSEA